MSFCSRLARWQGVFRIICHHDQISMGQIIKKEIKMLGPSPRREGRLLLFYFVAPWVLGVLLADGFGVDISGFASRHIGLLRFIYSAGIDIRANSIILLLYFPAALIYLYYSFKHVWLPLLLEKQTAIRLVVSIVVLSAFSVVAYLIFFKGFPSSALDSSSRSTRALLSASRRSFSFSAYVGLLILGWGIFASTSILSIKELLRRLKVA